MKPNSLFPIGLLSLGIALSASLARAEDPSSPPSPPSTAPAAPADGTQVAPPAPQKRMRGYLLGVLTEKLSLTADQQKKVGDILGDARSQVKALRNDDSLSEEDMRTKIRAVRTATRGQIRAVLTPEQQATFDALPARGQKAKAAPAN